MEILMYGWEFPSRISGELGVACHAIVKELAKKDVSDLFIAVAGIREEEEDL